MVGKSNLLVRYKPDKNGARVFLVRSDDAGAVLNTFGLYENVVGGKLVIYGAPKAGDASGNLFGSARMEISVWSRRRGLRGS